MATERKLPKTFLNCSEFLITLNAVFVIFLVTPSEGSYTANLINCQSLGRYAPTSSKEICGICLPGFAPDVFNESTLPSCLQIMMSSNISCECSKQLFECDQYFEDKDENKDQGFKCTLYGAHPKPFNARLFIRHRWFFPQAPLSFALQDSYSPYDDKSLQMSYALNRELVEELQQSFQSGSLYLMLDHPIGNFSMEIGKLIAPPKNKQSKVNSSAVSKENMVVILIMCLTAFIFIK